MTPPILVFGSYMHDLSFSMRDFPKPGQTIIGDFKSGPGGNQAVAAARTSVHTAFVGATGEDAFADLAKNFHQEEGVHSKWARREDLATGTAAIFVNDKGENEIVVALGANNSSLTAIGNDYHYKEVFARELRALGKPGDVFIGITTSGNSPNIIQTVRAAREMGLIIHILTGEPGGKIAEIVECLCIPSTNTARIQEAHILVGHIICELVEDMFVRESDYFK